MFPWISPEEEKQFLGNALYRVVHKLQPELKLAKKITGMFWALGGGTLERGKPDAPPEPVGHEAPDPAGIDQV